MEAGKQTISVDVVCDLICPWCWIGKRKLEKAVESLSGEYRFHVRWLPFLLRPDIPLEGIPIENEDLGHPKKKAEMKRAQRAGETVGLDLTFCSPVIPSSVQAHALVKLAGQQAGGNDASSSPPTSQTASDVTAPSSASLQAKVVELIFQAYLTEGKSLTVPELVKIGTAAGLDADVTTAFVIDDVNLNDVRSVATAWTKRGVSGVPCFYINGHRMFSGAQDEEMFKRMFRMAAQKAAEAIQVQSPST